MKTYKNVSRFYVLRRVGKYRMKRIKWAMSLKPGDLINDCSGFNVIIREIDPDVRTFHNGWFIQNVDFTVEPYGGGCSLMHCGVEPPKPRELLEKEYLVDMEDYLNSSGPGSASYWYGGLDNPKYKKEIENLRNRLDTLKNGGHILDERGILLPEFRKYG